MEVPHHIYVHGYGRTKHRSLDTSEAARVMDEMRVLEQMRVPDRIVLGGGNTHFADPFYPTEVMRDRMRESTDSTSPQVLPHIITATDIRPTDLQVDDHHVNNMSEASIAIEENPLRELRLMRRQLGRLTTRLLKLEDDAHRRSTRETGLWLTLIGSIAVIIGLVTKRTPKLW